MNKWEGLDKRKFPRIKYPCLIIIRKGDSDKADTVLTHTDNVGVGGVCVSLRKSVKTFSVVDLELDLLDMGDHVHCKGKVVWNVESKAGNRKDPRVFDVGVEFMDIREGDRSRLQKVIERIADENA